MRRTYADTPLKAEDGGIYVEHQIRLPSFAMSYEHCHPYCEIFYLQSGSCVYQVNGLLYPLSAGDLFLVAAGDFHSTRYAGNVPCERTVVCLRREVLPRQFWETHSAMSESISRSGKVVIQKRGQLRLEEIFARMLEEKAVPDRFSHEYLVLEAMAMFLSLERDGVFVYEHLQPESITSDIDDALRYIAQNFALPLTLEEVARNVNLSPTYLSKKFRKVTSYTFKEYLTYIRIRQASQMLLTTDDTITKIAMNCGFNSSNYFKDCFHRINGMSPRSFRNQAKRSLPQTTPEG